MLSKTQIWKRFQTFTMWCKNFDYKKCKQFYEHIFLFCTTLKITLYQKVTLKHCCHGISDYQHYHQMSTTKTMAYMMAWILKITSIKAFVWFFWHMPRVTVNIGTKSFCLRRTDKKLYLLNLPLYLCAPPISINKLIKTALSNGKIVQCNIEKSIGSHSFMMFHQQKCCEPFLQTKNKHFARKYFDDFGFWWAF